MISFDRCDHDINECESNPCQNGGTCEDLLARYACVCPQEFEGINCEAVKIITCDNYPCKNGSSCSNTKSEYWQIKPVRR